MTGARRPNNILPPIPNPEDEEGAEEEEEEDSDGSSNEGGSDASGTTTPLSREIRTYEERNRELARRLREFEQERLHQVNIQEGWKNAVITLEAKLVEMRAKVEVVEKEGAAALGRDVGFTLRILKRSLELRKKWNIFRLLSMPMKDLELNNDRKLMVKDPTWTRPIKCLMPERMKTN